MQDIQNKDNIAYLSLIYREVKETNDGQYLCRDNNDHIVIIDRDLNERKDLGSATLISVFCESLDDYFKRKHLPMEFKVLYSDSNRSGLITTAILLEDNRVIELADELGNDKCIDIHTLAYVNPDSNLGHVTLWTADSHRDKQYKLIDLSTGKLIIKDTIRSWERYSDIIIYETVNSEFIGVKLDSTFKDVVRIWNKTSEPSEDIKNNSEELRIFKQEQLKNYINKILYEDTHPEPGKYISTELKLSLRSNFSSLREFYSESNKYGYCGITEKAYERNVIKFKNDRCIDKIIYRSKDEDEHIIYKDSLIFVFDRLKGVADTCLTKLVNMHGEIVLDIAKLLESIRNKSEYRDKSIRFSGAESSITSKYIVLDGTSLNDEFVFIGEKQVDSKNVVTGIKQIYLGLAGSFARLENPSDTNSRDNKNSWYMIEININNKQYIVDFDKDIYLIIDRQSNEIEYVSDLSRLDIARYETYRVNIQFDCTINISMANRIGKLAMSEFYDPPELKGRNRVYFA